LLSYRDRDPSVSLREPPPLLRRGGKEFGVFNSGDILHSGIVDLFDFFVDDELRR
jgi:hypothetical protein